MFSKLFSKLSFPIFFEHRLKAFQSDNNIENKQLYLIVLIGFILRIIALPFSQVVDADATSRIFIAENWLDTPHLIYEGIWLPLHHYINAFAIAIFQEHHIGPVLFHIILACFTAIPLYHFTKREFSARGAWLTAAFYLLCPIIFRNSFHVLSGIPHAFFIALALNAISKSIRHKDYKQAIFAGLFMTIASGFRYEAWLLIALLSGVYLFFNQWKLGLWFCTVSLLFPIFWMAGNYIAHDHILHGVTGVYNSDIVDLHNSELSYVEIVKRIVFFPFSLLYLFSPIVVVFLGLEIFRRIKNK